MKTLKMCMTNGVFALVVLAQPAPAQTRRNGAATQTRPTGAPLQPAAPAGAEPGNRTGICAAAHAAE